MKKFFLFLIILIGVMLTLSETSASVSVRYEPAPILTLTGENSDVSFAVADDITDAGAISTRPFLDTVSRKFSGAFYIKSVGWALLATGSLSVSLDCGAQDITSLTLDCTLSGKGWSETIGDIDFSDVSYSHTLGSFSGSAHTFFGDIPLDNIHLPLLRAEVSESLTTPIKTTHQKSFSINGVERYGDGIWSVNIRPIGQIYNQDYLLSSVDLSYASTYVFTFTDPQGSKTIFDGVEVVPNSISDTLISGSFFIANFCNNTPSACPDGGTLSATHVEKTDPAKALADGKSFYAFRIKVRDTYGNTVNTGSLRITYTGTVSAVQGKAFTTHPYFATEGLHDALVFSGGFFIPDFGGGWRMDTSLLGQEINYGVASIAPTSGSDNSVSLSSIQYRAGDGTITSRGGGMSLTFENTYSTTLVSNGTPKIGASHTWSGNITPLTSEPLGADTTVTLSIGGGGLARFENLESASFATCQGPTDYSGNCDWYILGERPGVANGVPAGDFSLSGVYIPKTEHPFIENIEATLWVHYRAFDTFGKQVDVLYPSLTTTENPVFRETGVKIIGNNNALGEYGTIASSKKVKTDFLSNIRKNIALLSRNRTTYADANYTVSETGLGNITNTSFTNKRTLISIGNDIHITGNIAYGDVPLALIALTDASGNGGSIIIDPGVTDIGASLIAEHSITTSGTNQLHILGSVISSNTLGDAVASICPYFVTSPCTQSEAAKYDFEEMRKGFATGSTPSSHPTALRYSSTPIIIEYDINIEKNPPPGLSLKRQ